MHAFVQTTEMTIVDALEINRIEVFFSKTTDESLHDNVYQMMIAHSTAKVFDLLHDASVNL